MKVETMKFHRSWWEVLRLEKREIVGEVLLAVIEYGFTGKQTQLGKRSTKIFQWIKNEIDNFGAVNFKGEFETGNEELPNIFNRDEAFLKFLNANFESFLNENFKNFKSMFLKNDENASERAKDNQYCTGENTPFSQWKNDFFSEKENLKEKKSNKKKENNIYLFNNNIYNKKLEKKFFESFRNDENSENFNNSKISEKMETLKNSESLKISEISEKSENDFDAENLNENFSDNKIIVRKEKVKKSGVFVPPTVEEVQEYCNERKNKVDAQAFVDFYQSKGWFIGKNKMKCWRSAVHTWERFQKENAQKTVEPVKKYEIF